MGLRKQELSTLTGLTVTTMLLYVTSTAAGHDAIPDPPPSSVPRKLQPVAGLDQGGITVSGLSSGAFFAHQFHIAYSSLVKGAGLVAGGPYGCVENIPNPFWPFGSVPLDRVSAAVVACTHYFGSRYYGLRLTSPKAEDSLRQIREAWRQRLIDNPANLADDRVWLFHGRGDTTVPEAVTSTLAEVYHSLGLKEAQLQVDLNKPDWNVTKQAVSHGMPVAQFTGPSRFPVRECDQHEPPFVIQCGFDAPEVLLWHLYPEGFRRASGDAHRDGSLIAFDQTEFFGPAGATASLHRVGFAYVPQKCTEAACRLHVAFHGCKQNIDNVHDDFVRDGGYNRWAASNQIVVLYPQATASAVNPNGCWDFWGYSGASYATQSGPQMRAIKAMVERLLGQ